MNKKIAKASTVISLICQTIPVWFQFIIIFNAFFLGYLIWDLNLPETLTIILQVICGLIPFAAIIYIDYRALKISFSKKEHTNSEYNRVTSMNLLFILAILCLVFMYQGFIIPTT